MAGSSQDWTDWSSWASWDGGSSWRWSWPSNQRGKGSSGQRWIPNPANERELQLRHTMDLKWEREKRRRAKRAQEKWDRDQGVKKEDGWGESEAETRAAELTKEVEAKNVLLMEKWAAEETAAHEVSQWAEEENAAMKQDSLDILWGMAWAEEVEQEYQKKSPNSTKKLGLNNEGFESLTKLRIEDESTGRAAAFDDPKMV